MNITNWAIMYDADMIEVVDGQVVVDDVGTSFSDFGFMLNIGDVVMSLSKICETAAYKNKHTTHISAYGMWFDKEFLEDCSDMVHEDVVELFTELYNLGKFEPPETRKRKVINRSIYSKKKRK